MAEGRHRLGTAAVAATAILWGSNHVVARAVREMVPLPSLVFWRWLIGAGLLTLFAWPALTRAWPAIRAQGGSIAVGGVVGVGLFSYLLLGGAYYSLALEVGLINATTPVWVALIGAATGAERLGAGGWFGLLLALAGTLTIIAKGDPAALAALQLGFGNLLSLLGAITFAWFSLRVRVWARTIDALAITVTTAWAGLILVMLPVYVVSVALGGGWLAHPTADLPLAGSAIAFTAIGPTMLGNLLFLYGIGVIGPTRAATFLYLSPAASALMSITLLGERLAWYHVAGVAVIAVGLWLITRPAAAGNAAAG